MKKKKKEDIFRLKVLYCIKEQYASIHRNFIEQSTCSNENILCATRSIRDRQQYDYDFIDTKNKSYSKIGRNIFNFCNGYSY